MIKLTERITDLLCRVRKIEHFVNQIEKEMEGISTRDFELAELLQELTERELEILTLMTTGKNFKEVHKILGMSKRTAQAHRWNIQKKLKLQSSKEIDRIVIPFMQKKR